MQDSKPIAYASRSMTSAEKNYSQIKKEVLSIVFAVQKFHQYTGWAKSRFTVITLFLKSRFTVIKLFLKSRFTVIKLFCML